MRKAIMTLHKQAKVLTDAQVRTALRHLEGSRYPERDRVMFLLSVKAGLRAIEIAALEWAMVTDSEGGIADAIGALSPGARGDKAPRAPAKAWPK